MTFPTQHRTKLHSTNPLERLNVGQHVMLAVVHQRGELSAEADGDPDNPESGEKRSDIEA
jgi:hypothetical protein